MTPRRHTLPISDADRQGTHAIMFYDWGDVDAANTVICVHGLTRNAHDFDFIAQDLAGRGYRVFSLNMAGRGESAWLQDPMGYNYATYVTDCIAVMDNFHLRNVSWIGTSMGGIIGMMIAAQQGNRIKKLVLNDIGAFLSKEALGRIYEYVQTMPHGFPDRAAADRYLAEIYKSFGITDLALWQQFVDNSLIANPDGSLRYACDPAIAVPLREGSKNYTEVQDVHLMQVWEQIAIPTFVLHGAESDVLSPETIRAMRVSNPRLESHTIPGVGHAPSLMSADQIRLVGNWLSGSHTAMLASGL